MSGSLRLAVPAVLRISAFVMTGVALLAMTAVLAAAASLVAGSGSLGAGAATTPRCTTAGHSVLHNLSAGTIVSVAVGRLPASCGNATLEVTVNNGLVSASGPSVVPAGGGSVTVTLVGAPAVVGAVQTDLILIGP